MARTRKQAPAHWNPIQRAAYEMIHNYEGADIKGPAAFEEILGKSPKTISNEVNANIADHKLGLDTAIEAEIYANETMLLHAHAQMRGHVAYAVPSPDSIYGDVELLTKFAEWQSAMGETCTRIHKALDPNGPNGSGISKTEAQEIANAGQAHMSRFMEFLQRVNKLAE